MREIQKIKNPQVGIYYDENNIPYLAFKAEYYYDDDSVYEVNIPKIDLSKMRVDLQLKQDINYSHPFFRSYLLPPSQNVISEVTFDIEPNQNYNYYTLKDLTPPKEMTIGDIEKELGYKVKIKNN